MAEYSSKSAKRTIGGDQQDAEGDFLITQSHHMAYSQGKIFVSEMLSHNVKIFQAQDGKLVKTFGGMGFFDGEFNVPAGIAFLDGNAIVCDVNNGRLQTFDADGNFLREYGSKGDGPGCFRNPNSIVVDSQKNVYVAEAENKRVQILDKDLTHKAFITGKGDEPFKSCNAVGFDHVNNRVIITDSDADDISLFDPTSGQVVCSLKGESGEFGSATEVIVDQTGNIIVCEMGENKVVVFDKNGAKVGAFAANHEFSYPEDICMGDGEIFILEGSLFSGWSKVTVF